MLQIFRKKTKKTVRCEHQTAALIWWKYHTRGRIKAGYVCDDCKKLVVLILNNMDALQLAQALGDYKRVT